MSAAARKTDLAQIERTRLLRLERQAKGRAEEADVIAHREELKRQAELRGAEYEEPKAKRGERRKPMRRLTGLDWLHGKGRITEAQKTAGERYGAAYRRAGGEQSLRSILNRDVTSADGRTLADLLAHAESAHQAKQRLAQYRGRLFGQSDLVGVCDLVCGKELTPRESAGDGHEANRIEAVLKVALDLLAR